MKDYHYRENERVHRDVTIFKRCKIQMLLLQPDH